MSIKDWEEWKKKHHVKLKEDLEKAKQHNKQIRDAKKKNPNRNYSYKI